MPDLDIEARLAEPAEVCHACDRELNDENRSAMPETCTICEAECLCWVCRDTHHMFAEDRAEQAAFDAWREAV